MLQRKPRFSHTTTEQLYQYWNQKRGKRSAPERSQIEPSEIRTLLPDTFILSVEPSIYSNEPLRRFSWRLAGTRVCALHCRELKERDFLTDWLGRERETMESLLNAIVDEAAVTILHFDSSAGKGNELETEMVLMPLSIYGRASGRILGSMVTLNDPYWLGIQPPTNRKIRNTRLLWPSGEPLDFNGEVPSLASAARAHDRFLDASARDAMDGVRRYRHLTVLNGGKA